MNPESVMFIAEAGDSASAWVRAHVPGKGLAKRGWTVVLSSLMFQDDHGLIRGAAPASDGKGLGPLPPTKYVVLRRINELSGKMTRMEKLIVRARSVGQRVFFDLDDDPWNLPEWNPSYGNLTRKQMQYWADDMKVCDGILCTTPALALSVADHVPNVPIFICANGVDLEDFQPSQQWEPNDPYRLGWMGTVDFRGKDLQLIVDPLRRVLDGRFQQVEFWHFGMNPQVGSIHDVLGPKFPVQVREFPWMPVSMMNKTLSALDAAAIPIMKHPFNEARSAVSGLKMMAAGVPFVVSATAPYVALWRQGGGYAVDNEPETWLGALHMLVDPEYVVARRDIRTSGLVLTQRYGPEQVAVDWEKAFHA